MRDAAGMKLHAAVKITHPFQVFLDEAMKGDLVHDFRYFM